MEYRNIGINKSGNRRYNEFFGVTIQPKMFWEKKMNDSYVEILVKRNVEREKKKREIIVLVAIIVLFFCGIATSSLIFFCLSAISILGYNFWAHNYCIEFEYFYMDGELTISKIVNKSRRKKMLELNDGVIKIIAPVNSAEINEYNNLEKKDCTANEPSDIPYAVVYMEKKLKRVDIQMTDELYKEFRRNMPYKVKNY